MNETIETWLLAISTSALIFVYTGLACYNHKRFEQAGHYIGKSLASRGDAGLGRDIRVIGAILAIACSRTWDFHLFVAKRFEDVSFPGKAHVQGLVAVFINLVFGIVLILSMIVISWVLMYRHLFVHTLR